MKRVNDSGFTLIEVLAVFTILAIILSIGLPELTKTIKNNDVKKCENFKKTVEMAAEVYYESKKNVVTPISVTELKQLGYLKDTNEIEITNTMVVNVTSEDGVKEYTFSDTNPNGKCR